MNLTATWNCLPDEDLTLVPHKRNVLNILQLNIEHELAVPWFSVVNSYHISCSPFRINLLREKDHRFSDKWDTPVTELWILDVPKLLFLLADCPNREPNVKLRHGEDVVWIRCKSCILQPRHPFVNFAVPLWVINIPHVADTAFSDCNQNKIAVRRPFKVTDHVNKSERLDWS